jgi:hypothetical protein
VSNNSNLPFNSWLPKLDADRRFPGATGTLDPDMLPGEQSALPFPDRMTDWTSEIAAQFGITSSPMVAPADEATSQSDTIEALRERLAYYEHFDTLIRDNVSRSAELFRAVFAEKVRISQAPEPISIGADAVTEEVDRRIYAERVHNQHVLMSLMDEATYVQQRADVLIQRLAEALTELANHLPEEDEPVSGA